MKGEKLLAEWLWIDRWMGSSAFLLPMETRGLYREMLTQAWRRGARLPNDHEAIQRATGCTAEEWARCWPRLARYWREDGDSLVNDTQIEVYAETVAARERASERGRKGAQATAQARAQVPAQAAPEHPLKHQLKHKPPSPSPSPTDNGSTYLPTVRANPLVAGRRVEMERECLALVAGVSKLTGEDPVDVLAGASHYDGAHRTKINPSSMTDDRLANTVRDLRRDLAELNRRRDSGAPIRP